MKRYKAYILDFDGTLIDSYDGLSMFYDGAFGAIGYPVTEEEKRLFPKISLQEAYAIKVNKPELLDDFTKAAWDMVNSGVLLKHNKLYKDTLPFINYLKDNNIPNAIFTGNATKHVNMVLNNLEIDKFYNTIICSIDIKKQKPDPEGILLAIQRLNYQGDLKDICYVGDSYNDFLAAKSAGVTPILIDRYNEFEHNKEYIRIEHLEELINK